MRRQDSDEPEICAICHEEIEGESERDFRCSPSTIVCHDCARKHGGVYSLEKESWTVPPRLPRRNILSEEEG